MNTHTPGPWHNKRGQVWSEIIRLKDGSTMSRNKVCDVAYHAVGGWDEMSANARLIAAAPELLAACQAAIDAAVEYGGRHGDYTLASLLNMVIRKATTGEY